MLVGCVAKDGDAANAIGPPLMTIFILFSGVANACFVVVLAGAVGATVLVGRRWVPFRLPACGSEVLFLSLLVRRCRGMRGALLQSALSFSGYLMSNRSPSDVGNIHTVAHSTVQF